MIFQHTWEQVLSGEKTQTRRIVNPRDQYLPLGLGTAPGIFQWYPPGHKRHGACRPRFVEGRDYAVQPRRGRSAVARITILRIRPEPEDVRTISQEDARREGLYSAANFMETWERMYKPYMAWVIEFELQSTT